MSTEENRRQLVELVTQEVLRALSAQISPEGPAILVIGEPELLPKEFLERHTVCSLAQYAGCEEMARWEGVYITALTCTQLADIALGRDESPAARAVINVLLQKKPVRMLETAPAHRRMDADWESGLYRRMESYVETLREFGVQIFAAQGASPGAEKAKPGKPPQTLPPKQQSGRLVTEAMARSLAAKGEKTVVLGPETIVTPSAKDVFLHAGITVRRDLCK